jgi:predicted lipoprotein
MSDPEMPRDPQTKKTCDPQAAAAWRRKHDPNSFEALEARLEFLQSRVNAHSDPYIQKLIAEMKARIADRVDFIRRERAKKRKMTDGRV